MFYSNRPPFTVHWRSRHSHAELAAKSRLPPRPPSSEEIDFLNRVLEDGLLDGREPPRPPGSDVDAICHDPEESW